MSEIPKQDLNLIVAYAKDAAIFANDFRKEFLKRYPNLHISLSTCNETMSILTEREYTILNVNAAGAEDLRTSNYDEYREKEEDFRKLANALREELVP